MRRAGAVMPGRGLVGRRCGGAVSGGAFEVADEEFGGLLEVDEGAPDAAARSGAPAEVLREDPDVQPWQLHHGDAFLVAAASAGVAAFAQVECQCLRCGAGVYAQGGGLAGGRAGAARTRRSCRACAAWTAAIGTGRFPSRGDRGDEVEALAVLVQQTGACGAGEGGSGAVEDRDDELRSGDRAAPVSQGPKVIVHARCRPTRRRAGRPRCS